MSGTTVSVACKMPNGVILRLYDFVDSFEQILGAGGGMRKTQIARRRPIPDVVLKGFALPRNNGHEAFDANVQHGCGLTHNVDASFWEEWLTQNADSDLIKNGIVFSQTKVETIKSEAKERAEQKSGLEPLNPETKHIAGEERQVDPRWPRKIQRGEKSPV